MSSRQDGEPRQPLLAEDDDWFSTPLQEPTETDEFIWQDDTVPPPRAAPDGLGQRQVVVVLASIAAVVLIAGGILLARAVSGSDRAATKPGSTAPPTTPVATTTGSTNPASSPPTTTTPGTSAVPTDATLRAGSTGSAVTALQRALTRLGYAPGAADGNFGSATTLAVIAFQKAQGLTEDGVAGTKTLAAINTALAQS